jgi:uncharacterized protein (TIGR00375 family)
VALAAGERTFEMKQIFCDLHVHIGRAGNNQPVKITASRDLTLSSILEEAALRKGIDVVGVIDGSSPAVQADLRKMLAAGDIYEIKGGGLRYKDRTTLLLGAEVETAGPSGGAAHFGIWMPDLVRMEEFTRFLEMNVTNVLLSSQRARCSALELQKITHELGGWFIVNHAFTPHKGLYGSCVGSLSEMLDPDLVTAIELGLSADTEMADRLQELARYTFVTNSDAHSTAKIAREYNLLEVEEASFEELGKAFLRTDNRKVLANYGLHPRLGKYHRTTCNVCGYAPKTYMFGHELICQTCKSTNMTLGVADRLEQIAQGAKTQNVSHRPPYYYQIPLEYIPKVGKKTIRRLLDAFGTEMNVLHTATEQQLKDVVGDGIASKIMAARTGKLNVQSGGAGVYGKIVDSKSSKISSRKVIVLGSST